MDRYFQPPCTKPHSDMASFGTMTTCSYTIPFFSPSFPLHNQLEVALQMANRSASPAGYGGQPCELCRTFQATLRSVLLCTFYSAFYGTILSTALSSHLLGIICNILKSQHFGGREPNAYCDGQPVDVAVLIVQPVIFEGLVSATTSGTALT